MDLNPRPSVLESPPITTRPSCFHLPTFALTSDQYLQTIWLVGYETNIKQIWPISIELISPLSLLPTHIIHDPFVIGKGDYPHSSLQVNVQDKMH